MSDLVLCGRPIACLQYSHFNHTPYYVSVIGARICLCIQMHNMYINRHTLEQATTRAVYNVSGTEIELSVHEHGDR